MTSLVEQIPRRVWAPVVAWIVYLVGYPLLHPLLDTYTGVTASVPVLVTAWYGGTILGALAGVAAVPITAALVALFVDDSAWLSQAGLIRGGAMILVGAAVGHMRELTARHEAEIELRRGVETSLRERDERLGLVHAITRNIRSSESVDDIIRLVVDGLHSSFPEFRGAYSTVAPGEGSSSSTRPDPASCHGPRTPRRGSRCPPVSSSACATRI